MSWPNNVTAHQHKVRKPAVLKSASGSLAGPMRSYIVKGKAGLEYQVFERAQVIGGRRVPVRQLVLGSDFQAFWSDVDGDGRLDRWEMTTAQGTVSLHEPDHGRFLFLDVSQSLATEHVEMKFALNQRTGRYGLLSMRKTPAPILHSQSVLVGCQGSDFDKQLLATAVALNEQLRLDGSDAKLEDAVREELSASGCGKPPFKAVQNELLKSIMEVAKSDKAFAVGTKPATKGKFLQCLRFYELDVHATRIEAGFAKYFRAIANDKAAAWALDCKQDPLWEGSFDSQPGSGRITFNSTIPGEAARGGGHAYTFFHEMLHYSLIDTDATVGVIADCCATDAPAMGPSCKRLEDFTRIQKTAQQFKNLAAKALNFPLFVEAVRKGFGDNADEVLDSFFLEMGKLHDHYLQDPKCASTIRAGEPIGDCEADFKRVIQSNIETYFLDTNSSKEDAKSALGLTNRRCFAEVGEAFASTNEAELYCARLHDLTDKFLKIESADVHAQAHCNGATALFSWPREWMNRLGNFVEPSAFAATSDARPVMCALFDGAEPMDFAAIGSATSSNLKPEVSAASAERLASQAEQKQGAATIGTSSEIKPSTGAQASFAASEGPSRPLLVPTSTGASDRETSIESYLEGSSAVLSRTRTLIQSASETLLPRASASSTRAVLPSEVRLPGIDLGSSSRSIAMHVPSFQINDPMAASQNLIRKPASVNAPDPLGSTLSNSKPAPLKQSPAVSDAPVISPPSTSRSGSVVPTNTAVSPPPFASQAASQTNSQTRSPAKTDDYRQRKFVELLRQLEGPYNRISTELAKPAFAAELLDFGLQAIDDEGRVHGAGRPTCRVSFDAQKNRMVRELNPPCRAKQP